MRDTADVELGLELGFQFKKYFFKKMVYFNLITFVKKIFNRKYKNISSQNFISNKSNTKDL